jgi:SlyX protein
LNESINRLEEKIAYLERHVTEQDKAMLELSDEIAKLRREMKMIRERGERGGAAGGEDDDSPEERPPHY